MHAKLENHQIDVSMALEIQIQDPYPEDVLSCATRSWLYSVDTEYGANGHSTINVWWSIQGIHDYAVLTPVGLFNDDRIIILLTNLYMGWEWVERADKRIVL